MIRFILLPFLFSASIALANEKPLDQILAQQETITIHPVTFQGYHVQGEATYLCEMAGYNLVRETQRFEIKVAAGDKVAYAARNRGLKLVDGKNLPGGGSETLRVYDRIVCGR